MGGEPKEENKLVFAEPWTRTDPFCGDLGGATPNLEGSLILEGANKEASVSREPEYHRRKQDGIAANIESSQSVKSQRIRAKNYWFFRGWPETLSPRTSQDEI